MKYLLALLIVSSMISCDQCKECYLVEEVDGEKLEHYDGVYCGHDAKDKEQTELNCPQGDCYYQCK